MANILAEVKRHNIYRVAAAYAVVAWVLGQLVGILMPIFDLPQWIARAFLLFLAFGFPVALFFAWANQLAPERGGAARVSTGKLDWVLAGALFVVIALVSYQQLAPTRTVQSQQAGVTAARAASAAPAAAISVAVLPFVNLSGDTAQEFFSDGMSEEITSALAKIPDLRVVGRESAFQFKGEKKDLRAIGQALNATHLIEGSVRKVGDRVRITAQLVQADTGLNVWTDSFDREMTDVFAIQEDIATAIAGALRMPLGLKEGERLVSNRAIDGESYQQYLRAKALVRARGLKPLTDAAVLLEQVVAHDPDYAPAWVLLAQAYYLTPAYHPAWVNGSIEELRRVVGASQPRAEAAARRAIELDPDSPNGYEALALVQQVRGHLLLADELFSKGLAQDPNDPDALHSYSLLLAELGRLREALAMRQKLQLLDPFVPVFNGNTAVIEWLNGKTDAAIATLDSLPHGDAFRGFYLPRIYAAAGRYLESAESVQEAPFAYLPGMKEDAIRLLRQAPTHVASPQNLRRFGNLEFVYLHVGAVNRVMEFYENNLKIDYSLNISTTFLWHPSYAEVRKSERYKAYARGLGLVEYWRAKGWPDLCHPTTGDDFECS